MMKTKDFPAVIKARLAVKAQMKYYNDIMKGPSTLKTIKGNLLDLAEQGKFNIVVQGCNCFCAMGGGLAKEIRERYPYAAQVDAETVRGDYNKLGNWTESEAGDYFDPVIFAKNNRLRFDDPKRFTIINAYTQYNMSTGEDVFEYTAFKLILKKLAHQYPAAAGYSTAKFGFPKIGSGLAGGDEHIITAMIEDFSRTVGKTGGTVTIVEFKP